VGKIAEKAVCRNVFSKLTKTHSFRLFGDFTHRVCKIWSKSYLIKN